MLVFVVLRCVLFVVCYLSFVVVGWLLVGCLLCVGCFDRCVVRCALLIVVCWFIVVVVVMCSLFVVVCCLWVFVLCVVNCL